MLEKESLRIKRTRPCRPPISKLFDALYSDFPCSLASGRLPRDPESLIDEVFTLGGKEVQVRCGGLCFAPLCVDLYLSRSFA